MNTPEHRALPYAPGSPWTLLATLALGEAKQLPKERGIACLCNYLAQAYRQGCEDQQKLDRARDTTSTGVQDAKET